MNLYLYGDSIPTRNSNDSNINIKSEDPITI